MQRKKLRDTACTSCPATTVIAFLAVFSLLPLLVHFGIVSQHLYRDRSLHFAGPSVKFRGQRLFPSASMELGNSTILKWAAGCPATPALCRPQDFFDAVLLFSSSPSLTQRARTQLDAAGVEYTLLPVGRGATYGHGTTILHAAQLGLLAEKQPRGVLFLEDRITLAQDFPAAFDTAARSAPADWRVLWLCWLSTGFMMVPVQKGGASAPQRWVPPSRVYQACAVALSPHAAALIAGEMANGTFESRQTPLDAAISRWPEHSLVLWPPLAVAPLFTSGNGSSLGGNATGWGDSPAHWAVVNGVEPRRFDVLGDGYRVGKCRLAATLACSPLLEGVDFRGHNLVSPQLGVRPDGTSIGRSIEWPPVAAKSTHDCCAACGSAWPYCRAWTFVKPAGGKEFGTCLLKSSGQGKAAVGGSAIVSGVMVQACASTEKRVSPGNMATESAIVARAFSEDVAEAPGWPENRGGKGYIYCFAASGLTDSLDQLWQCADLALRHGFARVFFDMQEYAATRLSDVFDVSRFPVPLSLGRGVGYHIDALFVAGKLTAAAVVPVSASQLHGSPYPASPPPFKRNTLLIFCLGNGSSMAGAVLNHLSLSPSLRESWLALRARLPAAYTAVHVHNSGMHAHFREALEFIEAVPRKRPIVLVTDDAALATKAAADRGDILISPTRHGNSSDEALLSVGAAQVNSLAEALLDLLLLASGNEVIIKRAPVTDATAAGRSHLAMDLNTCGTVFDRFIGANHPTSAAKPCANFWLAGWPSNVTCRGSNSSGVRIGRTPFTWMHAEAEREPAFDTCSANRKRGGGLYLTYNSGEMQDGAGAQVHRIVGLFILSSTLNLGYVHSPIERIGNKGVAARESGTREEDRETESRWNQAFDFPSDPGAKCKGGELGRAAAERGTVAEDGCRHAFMYEPSYAQLRDLALSNCSADVPLLVHAYLPGGVLDVEPRFGRSPRLQLASALPWLQSSAATPVDRVHIAVHVRRGDLFEAASERMLPNSYFLAVCSMLAEAFQQMGVPFIFDIYSEQASDKASADARLEDFGALEPHEMHVNLDALETFKRLAAAHVLVISRSSFSYSAAMLMNMLNAVVVYYPFWHPALPGWTVVDENLAGDDALLPSCLPPCRESFRPRARVGQCLS